MTSKTWVFTFQSPRRNVNDSAGVTSAGKSVQTPDS